MKVQVSKDFQGSLRQVVTVGKHRFYADIAESEGGENSAPNPHDYFDAAIAACKALTIMMYAKRKGLRIDSLDLILTRDNSYEKEGIYNLQGTLHLPEHLTVEEKQTLLAIAERCPVHKLATQAQVNIQVNVE